MAKSVSNLGRSGTDHSVKAGVKRVQSSRQATRAYNESQLKAHGKDPCAASRQGSRKHAGSL